MRPGGGRPAALLVFVCVCLWAAEGVRVEHQAPLGGIVAAAPRSSNLRMAAAAAGASHTKRSVLDVISPYIPDMCPSQRDLLLPATKDHVCVHVGVLEARGGVGRGRPTGAEGKKVLGKQRWEKQCSASLSRRVACAGWVCAPPRPPHLGDAAVRLLTHGGPKVSPPLHFAHCACQIDVPTNVPGLMVMVSMEGAYNDDGTTKGIECRAHLGITFGSFVGLHVTLRASGFFSVETSPIGPGWKNDQVAHTDMWLAVAMVIAREAMTMEEFQKEVTSFLLSLLLSLITAPPCLLGTPVGGHI
jgi:hypothetical protein